MSLKSLNWAFDLDCSDNPPAKLPLLVLANAANDIGIAYPSLKTLQQKTGLSRSTVIRYLDDLEGKVLVTRIKRRIETGRNLSTLYLLSSHAGVGETEFAENYASVLKLTWPEYESAIKERHSLALRLPSLATALCIVSERDPILNPNPLLKPIERGGRPGPQTSVMLNDDLSQKIDDTIMWLQGKKRLKNMPPQEWVQLFAELDGNGIDLDAFKEFYEWVEDLDWVRGAITVKLLRSQVEVYLNRDKMKMKEAKNGGRGRGSETASYLKDLGAQG